MTDEPLLRVEGLNVEITEARVRVVRGVGYTVDRGETLTIVGESGSGKSMSVLSLLGLLPASLRPNVSGSARFEGVELVGASESVLRRLRGRRIGVVFQDALASLDPVMRIGDQIGEAVSAHRTVTRRAAQTRSTELLERVGIAGPERVMRAYPHELSGGMRQRVLIAMALAGGPDLLIADEPTTALDATIQLQVVGLLRQLQQDLGTSLVLITHDLGLVAAMGDRTLVMYAGTGVEQGRTADLLTEPRHPYTHGLLASMLDPFRWPDRPPTPIVGAPPDLTGPLPACPFAPRCPRATSTCEQTPPPLVPAGREVGWWHRCHFPMLDGGPEPTPASPAPHHHQGAP
ncbi:ABC transporter ATP-binding protein [Dactylosporangium roseum]|uniref:ABC transporter ATP-binding protein n=1 Tax=Dactylosporangium roseum TaxID=47989 RepID=A0ABY5ZCB4_9ACTN|nr:ABC transporter ATP-binding protein [Dactylosporangium roseum]UWZ39211.1 ABC transporter ATP-binding protein [Dactylosporangium roseum]